ncbi:transposase [Streptomyces sp. NK15101]|uniref:transposase n=1 Tax=Streptomyces sp. NK15101 TaxID=2873261 RepID=UPI001CEDDF94
MEPECSDRTPKRGGRWPDHRQVIDAIAFTYRTGTPWMVLPEHSGSRKGAHNRLRKRSADGTWGKAPTALLARADARRRPRPDRHGRLHHRPGSSARRRGPSKGAPAGEPDRSVLGLSRRGLTSKTSHVAGGQLDGCGVTSSPSGRG